MASGNAVNVCHICGKSLDDVHPDEMRMMDGRVVCEDCYFDVLGEEVERHPICCPRAFRGVGVIGS